jgi:hypothetical protein
LQPYDYSLENKVFTRLECTLFSGPHTLLYFSRENCSEKMEEFLKRCFYHSGQYDSEEHFIDLDKKLKQHEVCAFFSSSQIAKPPLVLFVKLNVVLLLIVCMIFSLNRVPFNTYLLTILVHFTFRFLMESHSL